MPNASSLVRSGRIPMISAAMSRSRMAIQARPRRPRTRFLATRPKMATNARAITYRAPEVALGPVTSTPNTSRSGAEVVPGGGQRVDQRRDEDRLQPVLAGQGRRDHEGGHQSQGDHHAILDDREDRLVAGVGRLELAGRAVDHGITPAR